MKRCNRDSCNTLLSRCDGRKCVLCARCARLKRELRSKEVAL